MTKDEINKKIEDENLRYQNKLLELNKEIMKEKEHHQREISYLKSQKEQISKNNEDFEYKSRAKRLAKKLQRVIEEALNKVE